MSRLSEESRPSPEEVNLSEGRRAIIELTSEVMKRFEVSSNDEDAELTRELNILS